MYLPNNIPFYITNIVYDITKPFFLKITFFTIGYRDQSKCAYIVLEYNIIPIFNISISV